MSDWDERYRRGEHAGLEPSELLVRTVEMLTGMAGAGDAPRRALDLACGAGRHALFLAARGFEVTAVDASPVAVEMVRERARERELTIDARVVNLETGEFVFEPEAYDLVCDFHYLQREIFPRACASVRPGGLFVAAIHMTDEDAAIRPMNPDFLLRPGELRAQFDAWEILHYSEAKPRAKESGRHARREAQLIARRASQQARAR